MKLSVPQTIAFSLTLATATLASAQGFTNTPPVRPSSAVPAASSASQSHRPVDPDMGDDRASLVAIQKVCAKDTPAADRSAICDGPISRG